MMKATILVMLCVVIAVQGTALDDYVFKEDPAYSWVDTGVRLNGSGLRGDSWTGYVLNMTSQRWLTDADFAPHSPSKSLWWHYLVVIVPNAVQWTRNASLYITGGGNDNPSNLPKAGDEDIVVAGTLAMANQIICGCLFQIPNQHVIFAEDPKQQARSEDAVIAYTWDHFVRDPSQPEWLVRFPMVKAAYRAMDTMTAFASQKFGYSLDYYMVAGASKRGWTTWDVGAVDAAGPTPGRVAAIVPIVLDAINFVKVMHHQYRSYGNWSFALKDYAAMNFMNKIDNPNTLLLQQEIDPFFYINLGRLTMPKLIVNAVMDEFQQPDDSLYWWDQMPEPKHFLICPNAEHSEATGIFEIVPAIVVFAEYLLKQTAPIPKFTWSISPTDGAITTVLDQNGDVYSADLWYAESCGKNKDGTNRRDFRVVNMDSPCDCGITVKGLCANLVSFWNKVPMNVTINRQGLREYAAALPAPGDGRWIAFMMMITYNNTYTAPNAPVVPLFPERMRLGHGQSGFPPIPIDFPGKLAFTTEVSVWPQTFPYPDCTGDACGNGLC